MEAELVIQYISELEKENAELKQELKKWKRSVMVLGFE